jgi:hypothetical protein
MWNLVNQILESIEFVGDDMRLGCTNGIRHLSSALQGTIEVSTLHVRGAYPMQNHSKGSKGELECTYPRADRFKSINEMKALV